MHKIKSKFKHIKKLLKNNTKLKVRFLVGSSSLLLLVIGVTTYFATYSDLILEFNDDPDYVESSVKDNKVIINEVESDYYYYKSLNYTSNDGTLPTTDNKDIYNDNNLVQTKITYKGNDGTNKGYVSLSERQDTYVYFKMFEVNDNNTADKSDDYVLIELIDNPFTDRPGDRGFNGWYTDYQNAKISYDSNYYERYVKVPVTYKDDKPEKIDITMIAKWTTAKVSYVGSNFNTAIRSLNTIGMKKVEKIKITYKEIDMTGYYYQVILNRGESYNGLYDERGNRLGNGTCRPNWWYGETTCTYYQRITNENFDENNTYYYLNNGYMTKLDNSTINREVLSEEVNTDLIDANMSTYYQEVSLNYGESQTGYYNANGEITTGTCNSYYGCTNYKLLQYYNDNGEEEIFDVNKDYYYLVTRDTNILVLNNDINSSWSDNGDYPFTITSLHNGTKYNVTWNANSAINCYNDINIENVTLYYGARINGIYNPPTNNTSGVLFGNYHNVKLGRGLTQNGNYPTLRSVVAGNSSSTGSNNNPTKYKFMLESGIYNSISLSMGASTSSWNDPNLYLNNKSVYGNDYDKVKKNNTALDIYYCASGSWGGNVYANTNSSTNKDISFDLTVKSGTFGSSKYDLSTGIYVGGRYGGTHYSARKAKIEGGYIYNLIGGPLSSDNRSGVNDIYIYMTGGSVDIIIGGAGTTATYGNRIVSVTGGTVNYSVFGGSNGSTGNEGDGTLNGTPYIYIGGTATIGDKNLISNNTTLFGGSNTSGEVKNTNIKNLSVTTSDLSSAFTISKSDINQTGATDILGSEKIKVDITNNTGVSLPTWDLYILTSKSIFDSNWSSSKVEFDSTNNIYHIDEANQWYGTNTLNNNSTYSFEFNIHSYDTYENFKILGYLLVGYDANGNKYIGKLNVDKIYGGNNLGGTTTSANINLTNGNINTIYGGGNKASVTTASTNINNVTVNKSIYGGGNEADVSSVTLNIDSSTIGNAENKAVIYGGGNAAKVTNSLEVKVNSSEVSGDIYGGGNKGEVETTVKMTLSNTHVTGNVFGGGNEAAVLKTDTKVLDNTTIDNNIYGGGNAAEVKEDTTLTVNNSTISNAIFGGGNGENSIVPGDETGELNPAKVLGNTNLVIGESTKVKTIYGGGNLGKVNKNTNVNTNNITVEDSIYGGGNAAVVGENTNIHISNTNVNDSVYAGGNGVLAVVNGNTNLDIDDNTTIGKHVFGGGNAAATGLEKNNNSKGIVNVVGATIGGNVYGGANTSRLYGDTTVNIGLSASSNKNLTKSPIVIGGTVFGGGEANASGSEEYDYSFISVTVGINININGEGYDTFTIGGSIFGSGNASSTTGYSYVNIKNYGTKEDIKRNISIQRANIVTLDNSYIELKGATDRTNEYSTVLFSLSRIDELKLINSSSLYLQNGGNLVKKLSSLAMNGTNEVKSEVTLDPETKLLSRNTNNRIYMLEGKNLNIATNENITSFGEVSGMTFFGMYLLSRNGDIVTALYNDYDPSAEVSSGDIYYFTKGSYVLGMHKTDHDITKDGFYTNYGNEEGNGIIIDYIEPTPDNADFYMWSIGEKVDSYEITLTASKYSTLGTYELSLLNHASANTKFSILGFNYATLNEDIKLINYSEIPRVADTEDKANTVFGLNMKSGQNGWITKGSTNFTTEGNNNVNGTIDYQRENSAGAPGLVFYFYHSKNLTTTQSLGSVTISLVAITPIDDLNNEVKRININVNLNTALYNTNDYEGTITPGKKYEMFATSPVDITTKSSFSTYYSLYMESDTTPYKEGYHRSLVSTYLLPVNTELTMIDFHVEDKPVYYYYTVTEEDYNNGLIEYNNYGEVSYPLSKFVKMGSTSPNNNYDDSSANAVYYKDKKTVEEFIFMVDFKDTNIDTDVLDKSLLIELRNNDNQTLISVLGIEQSTMKYDLYHNKDAIIELSGSLSDSTIYRGKSTNLILDTNFIQDKIATDTIFDTNYDEQKLGIKMTILDSRGTPLTSSSLMGVNYTYNGNTYYPRYDGTIRINITEKIANVRSKITINTENSNLSSGEYTLLIESFGSADGIYYGLNSSDQLELKFTVIDNIYGLKVSTTDKMIFINKDTGFTLNNNNSYVYKIEYTSGLSNPNIRLKLLRRDYSTIYTNTYNEVDLKDYVTNTLDTTNNEKEYLLTNNPTKESDHFLYFKDNLLDGTYKLVVSLYDNNTLIGEVYQYIIIK